MYSKIKNILVNLGIFHSSDLILLKNNHEYFKQSLANIFLQMDAQTFLRNKDIDDKFTKTQIRKHSRSSPVLLWGYSSRDFHDIYDILIQSNLDPCAIVSPSDVSANGTCMLPVLQMEDFAESEYKNFPVVFAPGLGITEVQKCMAILQSANPIESSQVSKQRPNAFHPCSMLHNYHYDINSRVLCLGFPGSGNVLVQSILIRLLPKFQHHITSIPFVGTLITDHQSTWKMLLQSGLNVRSEDIIFLPQDLNHISVRITCEDGRFLDLYDLVNPHWHTALIVPSHVLPTIKETQEWMGRGGLVVIVLRNPLDIIVSCAAKLLQPPGRLIGELAWFRRAVKSVVEYIDHIHSLPGEKLFVCYEDLLQRPHAQISRLANFFGVKMTLNELNVLWSDVGLKELVPFQGFNRTKNHFYQPGSGKWMQYLDIRHAEIVEEEGLDNRMRSIGYSFEIKSFKTNFELEPPLLDKEIEFVQVADFFHFIFGAPRCFHASSLYQARLEKSLINYVTNDPVFAQTIERMDSECLADFQAMGIFEL